MRRCISPCELASALDLAAPGTRVLSLDCFDTLLWRAVHAPVDVFAELKPWGVQAHARIAAEAAARRHARSAGRREVTLKEIHRRLSPHADEAELSKVMEAELAAEGRRCFGFAPTVELIRAARARGLPVVIVSDTYLSEPQLRALIATAAGVEVMEAIDRVFCSSAYGRSKGEGLFEDVLAELGAPAPAVLHVGDNPAADFDAPSRLGVQALHLTQFDAATERRLRMEATVGAILRGGGRLEQPSVQPHRAAVALADRRTRAPADVLGHDVVGPVMDAFVDWLASEREALRARSPGRPKMLFLMRDGHLPLHAFRARFGDDPDTAPLHLSRFAAIAAGLRSTDDIDRFCGDKLLELEPELIGPQLLLRPPEVVDLAGQGSAAQRQARFAAALGRPAITDRVLARARAFRQRLFAYLQAQVAPRPGDTLALVDLGYNGTVQNWIEPCLRDELGVTVAGRYLLHRSVERTPFDKRGMIEAGPLDDEALGGLARYISVLEQLCTVSEGSVVDYRDGAAVLRANDIKAGQSRTRSAVQAAALAYVQARPGRPRPTVTEAEERMAAAAVLGRLLFFPTSQELQVLSDFQHDMNLGTSQTRALFDAEQGPLQLREHGPFFLNGLKRMYLPAELAGAGLPLGLTVLATDRFGLDLRHEDFHPDPVRVPTLVKDAEGGLHEHLADAHPTHDGYLRCVIPVGDRRFGVALQLGRLYEWVQLDSLRFEPQAQAAEGAGASSPVFTPAEAVGHEVASPAAGLLHFETEAGLIFAPSPPRTDSSAWVLTAIFRPLSPRVQPDAVADARLAA